MGLLAAPQHDPRAHLRACLEVLTQAQEEATQLLRRAAVKGMSAKVTLPAAHQLAQVEQVSAPVGRPARNILYLPLVKGMSAKGTLPAAHQLAQVEQVSAPIGRPVGNTLSPLVRLVTSACPQGRARRLLHLGELSTNAVDPLRRRWATCSCK